MKPAISLTRRNFLSRATSKSKFLSVSVVAFGLTILGASWASSASNCDGTPTYQILREDVIINADIWD
ncbi:MAG: hypothetical protein DME77_06505 [Verrucomicrobia bacterium]|nr:MAG: hypothetical protein DME77_06505 [Verrucomicrobiota bacterium]